MWWPSLRQPSFVIVMSLVGCVGLAAAAGMAHRGAADGAEAAQMDDETTGSVGPFRGAGNIGRAALALSDEDRFHIYEGVMRLPDTPVADAPAAEVAESLRSELALQELPSSVIRMIPLVEGHKFVKFDDRIVVVNPTSRVVVAMIPRYKLLQ